LVNNLDDGMSWGLFPLFFASFGVAVDRKSTLKAVYPATWGILQVATGPLSDRWGRKGLIIAGMWVQAAGVCLPLLTRDGSLVVEAIIPLVAFCLRHFLADFIICMCEFDFRRAQGQRTGLAAARAAASRLLAAGRADHRPDRPATPSPDTRDRQMQLCEVIHAVFSTGSDIRPPVFYALLAKVPSLAFGILCGTSLATQSARGAARAAS
jgi:hypothetical protein